MNEIEEFLRRAAELRARQKQGPAGNAPPRAPTPAKPAPVKQNVVPPKTVRLQQSIDPVSGDDIAQHVQQHLDTSNYRQSAQQMAAEIRNADDVIEAHMESVFEHKLGALGGPTSQVQQSTLDDVENAARRKAPAPSGVQLAIELLQSPQSARQAFLLSEIMKPVWKKW